MIEQDIAKKATRQCWECLKRRLVCDKTLPICKKCIRTGKTCPGYGSQKPLQWLETGKVTSRIRRTNAPASTGQAVPELHASKAADLRSDGDDRKACSSTIIGGYGILCEDREEVERKSILAGRKRIEGILKKRLHSEAKEILPNILPGAEGDWLERLEKMVRYMELGDLPHYELRSETCEVVQAVQYYNARMLPTLQSLDALAPNPQIVAFPPLLLHLLPPAIHHNLVYLSLNHYVYCRSDGAARQISARHWSKIYQHRGNAIRELGQQLAKPKTQCSDSTITSVLMLMCSELQATGPTNWRTHAIGLMQLFDLRGGIMSVYRGTAHLHPIIVIFILIIGFSNTTSPAADQMIMNPTLDEHLADIASLYDELFPYCLCPLQCYQNMIRVNYIRYEAARQSRDEIDLRVAANELLTLTEEFAPRDWAQPGANFIDWLTIGSAYKSAVVIYCIMSFQSLGILPKNKELNDTITSHADDLLLHLQIAYKSQRLQRFLAWPLNVAGVEAAYRGEPVRAWIEKSAAELSHAQGAKLPLKMKKFMRMYWEGKKRGWEECFDHPSAFFF